MEGVIVDDEGDAEVENVWQNQFTGRNCILFLIDARKPMFAHTNATSYFKEAMLCCKNAMLDMARKQKNDLFGIMLFGTKISEGKFAPENVSILQELVVPSVSTIKRINSMIENDFVELREKFGDVDAVDITSAINYCQITIHVSKKKLYLKNIILMTYDDDPCGTDEKAAFRARKQANELYQHEIELDVVTIDSNFDSSKFFKELILTSRGELLRDWEGKDPIMKIEDVKNQIEKFTQKYSRRLSFLRIGHKKSFLRLQICLYKLYTEPKKSLTTVKHSDNNDKENGNAATKENRREVTVTEGGNDGLSQTSAQHGNTALSKQKPECSQLATTVDKEGSAADDASAEQQEQLDELVPLIAGSFINITKPELKRRMQASNLKLRRGFQLIGFVHTIEVPLYFSIGEPYFVVPYGRDKNSRSAFSHLLQKCIERQVSMFGWFCLTKSATPALTVLHPLEASTEGKGHPKGFQLCKVPFSDEMFEIDEKESIVNAEVSEEQLEAANKIVNKVTIPYRVDVFNDNEYLRRISMIEALAMDYSHCPDQEDSTYVDLEEVQERLGELSIMFNAGDSSTQSSFTSGKGMKRAATDGGSQSRAKQRRPMDIIEMIQRGEANRLTVAELKEVLKAEGVKSLSTMTKTRLVDIATRRFSSDSQQ